MLVQLRLRRGSVRNAERRGRNPCLQEAHTAQGRRNTDLCMDTKQNRASAVTAGGKPVTALGFVCALSENVGANDEF